MIKPDRLSGDLKDQFLDPSDLGLDPLSPLKSADAVRLIFCSSVFRCLNAEIHTLFFLLGGGTLIVAFSR